MPKKNLRESLLWLLRRRKRIQVVGKSMLPTLKPGDEILVTVAKGAAKLPAVGDIVLLQHPNQPELKILKRVTAERPKNHYFVEGDNPNESTDSRHFGEVSSELIHGRVTCFFD